MRGSAPTGPSADGGCCAPSENGPFGWLTPIRSGAGLVLGGVALVKAAAAVLPALVAYGQTPWPQVWRAISWAGAVGLVLYGGINVVVSGAVLAGLIAVESGYDRAAMIGHVALWDPLFALWGLALLISLWLSRRSGRSGPICWASQPGSSSRWPPRPRSAWGRSTARTR